MYQRLQKSQILEDLNKPSSHIMVLSGPRQVGKTTLIHQVLKELQKPSLYLAVDNPNMDQLIPIHMGDSTSVIMDRDTTPPTTRDRSWLVAWWQRARIMARQSQQGFVLIIDEIQDIPYWSKTVKGLWDLDRHQNLPLHVVLLGSAPLLIQKGMDDSLMGRFYEILLPHWSFNEMSEAFHMDLDHYIFFGGYPGSISFLQKGEPHWRNYIASSIVRPNIERDILAMQRVDHPMLLEQLFALSASYTAQIVSYTKLLGDLQDKGNTTTVARYLELLSHGGLITGLSNYSDQIHKRRRRSVPKLSVFNNALTSYKNEYTFEQAQADRSYWGRLVESAVGAHLLGTVPSIVGLYYWRHKGREVDFVLKYGPHLLAIEVKSGSSSRPRVSGLEAFKKHFKGAKTMIVGEQGVGIAEFLSTPPLKWFEK